MRREISWSQKVAEIPTLEMQYSVFLESRENGSVGVSFCINGISHHLGPRQTTQLLAGILMMAEKTSLKDNLAPEKLEEIFQDDDIPF